MELRRWGALGWGALGWGALGWGALALTTLACVGCAENRPEPPSVPTGPPGTLTVGVRDGLAYPYWLERLAIAIDGELMHDAHYRTEERPFVVTRVPVVEGEHTLSMLALVSFASTRMDADDGCRVKLLAENRFAVERSSAALAVDVFSRSDVTMPFAERVDVRFSRGQGGVDRDVELPSHCRDDGPLLEMDPPPVHSPVIPWLD